MAFLKIGNIFSWVGAKCCIFVTTNNVLNKEGALVMGAGVALRAKEICPTLPLRFGRHVAQFVKDKGYYGLIPPHDIAENVETKIGGLQTKYHWKKPSPLELIERSLVDLDGFAYAMKEPVHCVVPGIGRGGVKVATSIKMVEKVSDHVTFWLRPEDLEK